MGIIQRSIEITKTIKNMSRFNEIITVFAKNGFDEFILKSGVHKRIPNFVLPKSTQHTITSSNGEFVNLSQSVGFRLRKSFEELGPSFIKIGQLLSTREDIFDKAFIDEMKILRDQAKGIPFDESLRIIEQSLGKSHTEVFKGINPEPIGKASIGVVYSAVLLDGTDVVVKVRRPGIAKLIASDLSLITLVVNSLEKVSEELRFLGISRAVEDFGNTLLTEIDFRIEALNASRLAENLEEIDDEKIFYIPKIYNSYVTEEVLVMERLKGVPFSNTDEISKNLDVVQEKLITGVNTFIKSLLQNGFFHADLHGGNFFLLEDNVIGLIDFGLMGHLGKKSRSSLIVILYSLINHNYENLVYEFLDVAEYEKIPDLDSLIRDVRDALLPFVGLTVKQTNLSVLLNKVVRTLSRHQLFLPREWFIIFRALVTLDGVGKSLGMDFDVYAIIDDNLKDVAKEVISKENLVEEGILAGRDIISSLRTLPRHIRWSLREFAKRGYAFEIIHKGHEAPLRDLKNAMIFMGHTFLSGLFFISGVLLLEKATYSSISDIPTLVWIFWTIGFVLFVKGSYLVRKS